MPPLQPNSDFIINIMDTGDAVGGAWPRPYI